VTKRWIIKNARGEFLVGFLTNGEALWQRALPLVYTTEDLARVALPALASADVDVYTVERYS
jgi:hypothetical protein